MRFDEYLTAILTDDSDPTVNRITLEFLVPCKFGYVRVRGGVATRSDIVAEQHFLVEIELEQDGIQS